MDVLDEIKDKKEFRGLSDELVLKVIAMYSSKYNVLIEKERKLLVKDCRAKLRDLYSAFRLGGYDKRVKYLSQMKTWNDAETCKKILSLHISSKERLNYYPKLYKKLRTHFNFKTVLDIGCGMNVFSMPWMGRVDYYGFDVNKEDTDFCNDYLNKFRITGGIRCADIMSIDSVVKTDVCFIFKVLEGLESIERGSSKKLFSKITAPWIVVSFATKSLGGGKIISGKRLKWFEEMVKVHDKFTLGSEIYYVVKNY